MACSGAGAGAALRAAALVAGLCLIGGGAAAQDKARSLIFTCLVNGKKLTSDRPIPECNGVDQRVLNSDGSLNRVVPPTPTEDERSAKEAKEREASAERVQRNDAVRRDRNLTARFPDEPAHAQAREKALDAIRNSLRTSQARIVLLLAERKTLLDEAEFYVGKPLPAKLKMALDANDAALAAQKELVANQQAEVVRISALYDAELVRLKKLWGGAQPGSLGPLPGTTPVVDGKRSSR